MTPFDRLQARIRLKEIPALDGMRGISVLLMIAYHYGFESVPGPHGLLIFFVLSGFLITWLLLNENEKTGRISLPAFYERRVRRIFPAMYCYWIGAMAFLLITKKPVPWGDAVSSFLFFGNYYSGLTGHQPSAFDHLWSMGVEQQFYLFWPVVFIRWRGDLAKMTYGVMAIIGTVWVYRAVLVLGFNVSISYLYSAFDTRCDNLLAGCLLAILLKRGVWRRFWEGMLCHSAMPLLTIAALAVSIYIGNQYIPRYRDLIGFAIDPLLVCILLAQWVALSTTPWWGWLKSPVMRYLGWISYPLYLWQQMTLFTVRRVLGGCPEAVRFLGALGVTVILASLSYFLVEKRFLRRAAPRAGAIGAVPAAGHELAGAAVQNNEIV